MDEEIAILGKVNSKKVEAYEKAYEETLLVNF